MRNYETSGAAAIAEYLLDLNGVSAVEITPVPGTDRPDFYGPRLRIIAIVSDETYFEYLDNVSPQRRSPSNATLRALGLTNQVESPRALMERILSLEIPLNPAGIQNLLEQFDIVPLRKRWRLDVAMLDETLSHPYYDLLSRVVGYTYGLPSPWEYASSNYFVYVPVLKRFVNSGR